MEWCELAAKDTLGVMPKTDELFYKRGIVLPGGTSSSLAHRARAKQMRLLGVNAKCGETRAYRHRTHSLKQARRQNSFTCPLSAKAAVLHVSLKL